MASTFNKVKNRLERNGLSRTLKYIIFVVFLERFGIRINSEFILDTELVDVEPAVLDGFTLEAVNTMEQLSDSDREFLREYGEDTAFEYRFSHGRTCLIVRAENEEIAGAYWYGPLQSNDDRRGGMIDHCFTRHEYRGRGLYPWALRQIVATTTHRDTGAFSMFYIECSAFNYSSEAGIRKAGFVPNGAALTIGNFTLFKW